jgi:hypothetical protein
MGDERMKRIAAVTLVVLLTVCGGCTGKGGPMGPVGHQGPPGETAPFSQVAWIGFVVSSYGEHYGSRPFYKVAMLHDARITPQTFVNAYVQQGRNSVEEYIPVNLWLMAQGEFDPIAYGPIYFLQEEGGLWIVDANEFLKGRTVWISVLVPAG